MCVDWELRQEGLHDRLPTAQIDVLVLENILDYCRASGLLLLYSLKITALLYSTPCQDDPQKYPGISLNLYSILTHHWQLGLVVPK